MDLKRFEATAKIEEPYRISCNIWDIYLLRDAARGLGVSEVARPAQVSGVLAAMVAARGSSMRSTRLTSLITTSGCTVLYCTVLYCT